MRSRVLLSAVGVAATASLVTTIVLAGQSSATAAGNTLVVNEKFTGLNTDDIGKKGPSIGDRLTFRSKVTAIGGKKLGIAGGDCIQIRGTTETNALYHCTGTYDLDGGDIFAGGLFTFGKKVNTWSILGGTGKYRGASGQASFTTVSEDSFKDVFLFD